MSRTNSHVSQAHANMKEEKKQTKENPDQETNGEDRKKVAEVMYIDYCNYKHS